MGHEIEFSRTKFRLQLTPPPRSLPTSLAHEAAHGGTSCLRPELTHVPNDPEKQRTREWWDSNYSPSSLHSRNLQDFLCFYHLNSCAIFVLRTQVSWGQVPNLWHAAFTAFYLFCPTRPPHVHAHTHTHICCVQTVYEIPLLSNNKTANETFLPNRSSANCWLRILVIYHWDAGLAVTGPIRDTGQNVSRYSFVTRSSSSTVTARFVVYRIAGGHCYKHNNCTGINYIT